MLGYKWFRPSHSAAHPLRWEHLSGSALAVTGRCSVGAGARQRRALQLLHSAAITHHPRGPPAQTLLQAGHQDAWWVARGCGFTTVTEGTGNMRKGEILSHPYIILAKSVNDDKKLTWTKLRHIYLYWDYLSDNYLVYKIDNCYTLLCYSSYNTELSFLLFHHIIRYWDGWRDE